jgi:hypothetical protein
MTHPNAPVFLGGASETQRSVVRSALAAHPRFFTSHLPSDDVEVLLAWARTMAEAPSARRPLWLSEAAFHCREGLLRVLPLARLIHLVPAGTAPEDGCLCVDPTSLESSPREALRRVLDFLGESPLTAA